MTFAVNVQRVWTTENGVVSEGLPTFTIEASSEEEATKKVEVIIHPRRAEIEHHIVAVEI